MRKKFHRSLAVNIIGAIILLLVIFGMIVSIVGYAGYTESMQGEYAVTTYHMADTAAALVDGDHLDEYLAGEETAEYERKKRLLDDYCHRMNVTMIYVIVVDRSDYGRFVSVFNPINNAVDDTEYTEWELGHKRDTTNNEYRAKYQAIYEKKAPYETVYRTHPTDGQHSHVTTLVPVMDDAGEVAALLGIQRPMSELDRARRKYLFRICVSTLLLAFFVCVFAAIFIDRQFVSPIRRVSVEAERFARENTIGKELGDISRYEEVSGLAGSIDAMEREMVSYVNNLTAVTAEKERISAELSFARTIQESSIPNEFPAFPGRTDFDIFASMKPAKEVGGDFYNFFLMDDDHLAVVIGDVSGKGVPAALFMMVTNSAVRDRMRLGGTPADILSFVSDNICEDNKTDMFVTIWIGMIELSTGRVIAANAGHEDPGVYHKDGSFEIFKTKHDLVAGAYPGISYRNYAMKLEKGDKLFLYTDGAPEATDGDGNMFGLDRLCEVLNEYKDGSPKDILDGVHIRIDEFVGDAPQFDDLTMVCLELKEDGKAVSVEKPEAETVV